MQEFTQQTFTEERALFHTIDARISDSVFDVGESPLKECRKLDIDTTLFRYKYPLWYCKDVSLKNCTLFDMARAGIWYVDNISVSNTVIEECKDGYPELEEKKDFIYNVIIQEEGKFNKTIDQGLAILSDLEESMKEKGVKELDGEDAFKLYDTYGFPLDLTKEILEEKGYTVNEEAFQTCMNEQKEKGVAVIYVGEDLDVLLELCDRIVVLCGGQVSGVVDARKTDKREVGALMTLVRGGNKDE